VYRVVAGEPTPANVKVRIGAVADLHFGRHPPEFYPPVFTQASADADVLALCGDLTDHGKVEEAEGLARVIRQWSRVPCVAVLGNHDYESGQVEALHRTLAAAGVTMLDGDAAEIRGVGFAGTKGFCGGFGPRALGPWGEPMIKSFVQETLDETLKLERALARLRTPARIVLLHYSPVVSTVEGEPPEIFAFLGSSRLEEPLTRYEVTAVFHGHAHHGQHEGHTSQGAPVFNVSLPLLQRLAVPRLLHVIEVDGTSA
jgi:Icc-related predicted phosphoesterase